MADHFLARLAIYQNDVLHALALVAVDGSASGAVVRSLSRDYGDLVAAYASQESASPQAGSVPDGKKHDGPCWRNSHSDCGC